MLQQYFGSAPCGITKGRYIVLKRRAEKSKRIKKPAGHAFMVGVV